MHFHSFTLFATVNLAFFSDFNAFSVTVHKYNSVECWC